MKPVPVIVTMKMPEVYVVGMKVNVTSLSHASAMICEWAKQQESRYVCVAAVNNVMEAYDSPEFREAMNQADLVTPDGMPLVWALRLLGFPQARRVYGPDLTPIVIDEAARNGIPIGFLGGSPEALSKLVAHVRARFRGIQIGYCYSPPFRSLSPEEDNEVVREINSSGIRILFVGLGTPKQDLWMARHKDQIHAVSIGVGAAFDFLAGTKHQAPRWIMHIGMEWLFRLVLEPKRLWKRYFRHNPRFLALWVAQLIRCRILHHTRASQAGTHA